MGLNPAQNYKVRVLSNSGQSQQCFPGPTSDRTPHTSDQGKVYLAHSKRVQSCGGKSWLQELKAAGHTASAVRKLLPSFLFSLGSQHLGWCSPHSGWVTETPGNTCMTHPGVCFHDDSTAIEFSRLTITVSNMLLTLRMKYFLPIKVMGFHHTAEFYRNLEWKKPTHQRPSSAWVHVSEISKWANYRHKQVPGCQGLQEEAGQFQLWVEVSVWMKHLATWLSVMTAQHWTHKCHWLIHIRSGYNGSLL